MSIRGGEPGGSGPFSEGVWDLDGPWVRHLDMAWRAAADIDGAHLLPDPPGRKPVGYDGPYSPWKDATIAWWAPLFHLVFFGLGWPRPDAGLARWFAAGRPTDDPILRVIDRWYGDAVQDFIAWASTESAFSMLCEAAAMVQSTEVSTRQLRDRYADRREQAAWHEVWGGGTDSMHQQHFIGWWARDQKNGGTLFLAPPPSRKAVLVLPHYTAWYRALATHGNALPERPDGRSWKVTVVIEPLGVLGTYRRSRTSGRWFSGQHRVHELGIDPAPDLV